MSEDTETFYTEGKTWLLPGWLRRPEIEIQIEGQIDDALVNRVCGKLRAARFSPISTTWNSRGGQAQAGIRLYQALRRHPTLVKGHVGPGAACSSAAAIAFLGCDERSADTTARFTLHRSAYEGMGGGRESAELLRVRLALLDGVNGEMDGIVARRCGFRLQEVLAGTGGEVILTGFSARSHGLIHRLTNCAVDGTFSAPRNLPPAGGSTLRRHPSRPPPRTYR
jgi:ATP-dependent protease ClpP protease subunit